MAFTPNWRDHGIFGMVNGSRDHDATRHAAFRRDDAANVQETLLVEWQEYEASPTKYWLLALSASSPIQLNEVGLGHYKGHGWSGFQHNHPAVVALWILDLRNGR